MITRLNIKLKKVLRVYIVTRCVNITRKYKETLVVGLCILELLEKERNKYKVPKKIVTREGEECI